MLSKFESEYQYNKSLININSSFQTLQDTIRWSCANNCSDLVQQAFDLALAKDLLPNHEILINKTLRELQDMELAWKILMYAQTYGWANEISYTTLIRKANLIPARSPQEQKIFMEYAEIAYASIPKEQMTSRSRATMLMTKAKLAGIDSAIEFFYSLDEEDLSSGIFTSMISIYFGHGMSKEAHDLYARAINTSNFVQDPELHALMLKYEPLLAATVYEIAARANAVHDRAGIIIRSYNGLSKQIGTEVQPLQDVQFHSPDLSIFRPLSRPFKSSVLDPDSSSSAHSSFSDKTNEFLWETSSVRSKPHSQSSISNNFEEEVQRYRSGVLGDTFNVHLDMLENAGKNHRLDILKEAFDSAYRKDRTNHQLLFMQAMKSANECNIELTHYYYLEAIKAEGDYIAFHSQMVKFAGEHAHFAFAMEAYRNGITSSKPGEAIPGHLSFYPANTLHNIMILAMGNCKRLDKAILIYRKMIDAKEKSLAMGENNQEITDMVTHSSMMAAAFKNDSFEKVIEAYNNAKKYNEYNLITFRKMMSMASEKVSEEWMNDAYSEALKNYPEHRVEIEQRYEKALIQLQTKAAVQKFQKLQDERNAPDSFMSQLSTDILAGLEEDGPKVVSHTVNEGEEQASIQQFAKSPEASGLILRRREPNDLQALDEKPSAWNRDSAIIRASSSRDTMFPALPSRVKLAAIPSTSTNPGCPK